VSRFQRGEFMPVRGREGFYSPVAIRKLAVTRFYRKQIQQKIKLPMSSINENVSKKL